MIRPAPAAFPLMKKERAQAGVEVARLAAHSIIDRRAARAAVEREAQIERAALFTVGERLDAVARVAALARVRQGEADLLAGALELEQLELPDVEGAILEHAAAHAGHGGEEG